MSDATPTTDDHKKTPPPADAAGKDAAGEKPKAADAGDHKGQQEAAAKEAGNTLYEWVHDEMVKGLSLVGLGGDKPAAAKPATDAKPVTEAKAGADAQPGTPAAATADATKAGEPAKTGDAATTATATAAATTDAKLATTTTTAASDSSWFNFSMPELHLWDSEKGTTSLKPADGKAVEDKGWMSRIWDAGTAAVQGVADFAGSAWSALSHDDNDLKAAMLNDSDNKTTQLEARTGADGKPQYFLTAADAGARILSEGGTSFTDARGAKIFSNAKTGEISSTSADGKITYSKLSDGTQIYKSADGVEYTRSADGKKYEMRDDAGHLTEVSDQGQITRINEKFSVAQHITSIDMTKSAAIAGQLETMTDGQRYKDFDGNVMIARNNGVREFTTADGHHYKFDRRNHTKQIEENGVWRDLTPAELNAMPKCHWWKGRGGQDDDIQINGVKFGPDGQMTTAENVVVGAQTAGVDTKMVSTIPPADGVNPKDAATVTTNPDHTSSMVLNGKAIVVNPDDPKHLVSQVGLKDDGTPDLGGPQFFNFNSEDNTFCTPDLTWDQWGDAALDWMGLTVTNDNDFVDTYSHETIYSSSSSTPAKIEASNNSSEAAMRVADGAVAAASSKIGAQSLTSSDLSDLTSSLSSLAGAMAQAMSCGNWAAFGQIMAAKGEVESTIGIVAQQVAMANVMRSSNMTEGQIVANAGEVGSKGIIGAMAEEDARSNGANAVTAEGRAAYAASHPTEQRLAYMPPNLQIVDEEQRLTA